MLPKGLVATHQKDPDCTQHHQQHLHQWRLQHLRPCHRATMGRLPLPNVDELLSEERQTMVEFQP